MDEDRTASRRPFGTADDEPTESGHGSAMSKWAVGLFLAVLLFAAMAGGVLIGRSTNDAESATDVEPTPTPPSGNASAEVAAVLEDRIASWATGDGAAVAAFYTPDGVMEERDVVPAVVSQGREQIAERMQFGLDLDILIEPASPVIQIGRFAAEAVTCSRCGPGGTYILVYEFDENLKIKHEWVIGGIGEPDELRRGR